MREAIGTLPKIVTDLQMHKHDVLEIFLELLRFVTQVNAISL